jgi:LEA14-like dessication related protein
MNFKIESGIPIPENSRSKTGLTDTMGKLKVGQSFVCDCTAGAVSTVAKRLRMHVTTKLINGKRRIWRVS